MDAVIRLVQQDGELMNIYTGMLKQALREQTRHKYMLSLRGEERFAWFYENYAEIADIIPSRRVAQFLNLDPATLSRIRKKQKAETNIIVQTDSQ